MPRRRDLLLLGVYASPLTACSSDPEATKALRATGIAYTLPRGWTQEDAEDKQAVFMLSPEIKGGVAATAMIELPRDQRPQDIDRLLREQAEGLSKRYSDYTETQLDSNVRIGENFFGVLAYTATKKQVPLTEQYMLLGLKPSRTVLVFTSVATDVISDYRRAVQEFLVSIRVATR
jgi:hypothetical protein